MGEKLIIGPYSKGLQTAFTPFNIDNDAFPSLINAYQWRGRIKRKRGTSPVVRLQRYFNSLSSSYTSISTITLDGSGNGNLITGFGLEVNGNIVPKTGGFYAAVITDGAITYTDNGAGVLVASSGPNGSINYSTGAITIAAAAGHSVSATFFYYPSLPVLGLEDFAISSTQFPGTLAFDETYAYNISTVAPYTVWDVSFYKNPTTPNTPKTNPTPTWWNGNNYQQFWSVNYQGAFWVTNGIDVNPTVLSKIGMQYAGPTTTPALTAATRTSSTTMTFTVTGNPLQVGDYVFANEFTASGGGDASTLNYQTGYVTVAGNTFTVKFPNASITAGTYTPGILQYLTNRSNTAVDCIRWYDGDPTNASATAPSFTNGLGWVNFMPPLSQSSYVIAELPSAQYYLVGAKLIWPYKDRLLFLGPVVQTSSGAPIYLQDTVIYSQNGTPYYTASFTGSPTSSTTVFNPLLVPSNQTAQASAWFEDSTGFGGFVKAGINQPIISVANNEDVLIVGFQNRQTRLVYLGNDILPFDFFSINSELGTSATFSTITLDQGVITSGPRGLIITSQTNCSRYDLDIPDQVFEFSLQNNGTERITAQRDFINEWLYLSYINNQSDTSIYKYPNQTLQYNYRDQTWGIFNENYTTYGQFRTTSGITWATIGTKFATWSNWNEPWDSGSTTIDQPDVIAGNQQGFVVLRDDGTNEANSLWIQGITGNVVTSPDHGLNAGDYIVISGCVGMTNVNGNIYSVTSVTQNTFALLPYSGTGTYLGGGLIQRMYVPFIQTKQFNPGWGISRKTRIGPQQYLLSTTQNGQVTLLIFLSENPIGDPTVAYNLGTPGSDNALIYTTTLYTCPESTNLGLTAFNVNLQTPTSFNQNQIWHRVNTSLIGDTVQVAITMNDAQMRDTSFGSQFAEIELHGIIMDINPSQLLV